MSTLMGPHGYRTSLQPGDILEINKNTLITRVLRGGESLNFEKKSTIKEEILFLDFLPKVDRPEAQRAAIALNGLISFIEAMTGRTLRARHRSRAEEVLSWEVR